MIGEIDFQDQDLCHVKFDLQRIKVRFSTVEELDLIPLKYIPSTSHVYCMTPGSLVKLIVRTAKTFSFDPTVYFHPNFRVDGFQEFRELHERVRGEWVIEQERFKEDVAAGKRGLGKKGKKDKVRFAQSFPSFPREGRFWVSKVTGHSVFLWPPRLFLEWVRDVNQGIDVSFDPIPEPSYPHSAQQSSSDPSSNNVAGPSNSHSAREPPSRFETSPLRSPPPSPPLSYTGSASRVADTLTMNDDEYDDGGISDSEIMKMTF